MAHPFECEVRYSIPNIQDFEKKLENLGGRVIYPYEFTDFYYRPAAGNWDPTHKNLRIREWKQPANPTTIYFTANEVVSTGEMQFKRAIYKEGKVPLYTGDLETCMFLLSDLGFVQWLTVEKKNAKLWELPQQGFNTAIEYIDVLGWVGELEFEGTNVEEAEQQLHRSLKTLAIPNQSVTYKPISAIVAEKRGLL